MFAIPAGGDLAAVFTKGGKLTNKAIDSSRVIKDGHELRDARLIVDLTNDGSDIRAWNKMVTQVFEAGGKRWQVHFYANAATGAVRYDVEFKTVWIDFKPKP